MADGAGIVEEIGENVHEFSVGDHVVSTFFPTWLDGEPFISDFSTTPGDGTDGFACKVVIRPATAFTRAPQNYSHIESAMLTTAGVSAWRALIVDGHLQPGETVLVLGTGGVSIFAIQIAKAFGARVIITSSSDQKLERALKIGADHAINYNTVPNWSEQVLKLTDGKGVEHVLEMGGPGTLNQSIQSTKIGGHIALIGVLTGQSGPISTGLFMLRQQRLQGLIVGSRKHQQDLVKAIDEKGITPIIDQVFSLQELPEAFNLQRTGHHFGKIAIKFD